MSTYNPTTFTNPDHLKRMDGVVLLRLLLRFKVFFTQKGLDLLRLDPAGDDIPYERVARLLTNPDEAPDLAESLYLIHEMSTQDVMDELLEMAPVYDLEIRWQRPTPADVATLMWLHDPEALVRLHMETRLTRPRAFKYFQAFETHPDWEGPDKVMIAALEGEFSSWFRKRKRGEFCRVYEYQRADSWWFVIWYGQPFRREGSIVAGEPSSVYYRPEKFDVVVYRPALGELRVHATTKGELNLYLDVFGEYFLSEGERFSHTEKYALDVLLSEGRRALVCDDVDGIDWIQLVELFYDLGGSQQLDMKLCSRGDLFTALEQLETLMLAEGEVKRARFRVKFSGSERPRTLTVETPNKAKYTRDPDSLLLDTWLERRGFVVTPRDDEGSMEPPPTVGVGGDHSSLTGSAGIL